MQNRYPIPLGWGASLRGLAKILSDESASLSKAIATGDLPNCTKEAVIGRISHAVSNCGNPIIMKRFVASADDWNGEESRFPKPTASIAISIRDEGNLESCAIKAVFGDELPIAVGSIEGVWLCSKEGKFIKITGVNKTFCDIEITPQLCVYGQKSKPHWKAMAHMIAEIVGQGVGVYNSMGPFWMLSNYFGNFDASTGTISPYNIALCESYVNEPKEEIIFTLINWLNCSLPVLQRFIITNMTGEKTVFSSGHVIKATPPVCEKYCAPGLIVAPTDECHQIIMNAFCNAAETIREEVAPVKVKELISSLRVYKTNHLS